MVWSEVARRVRVEAGEQALGAVVRALGGRGGGDGLASRRAVLEALVRAEDGIELARGERGAWAERRRALREVRRELECELYQ
jgi:hypothetical protein